MSFFQFNCDRNEFTDILFRSFHATPLRVPDELTRPLLVVGHRGSKTQLVGPLADLMEDSRAVAKLKPEVSMVPDFNHKTTGKVDARLGLSLLKGFLQGYDVQVEPVDGALKNAAEVSLSFNEVRKKHIFPIHLGNALINNKVNLQNTALSIFTRSSRPLGMYLITTTLECKSFSLNVERFKDASAGIEVEGLEKLVDAQAKLEKVTHQGNTFTFDGKRFLTFAFACVELFLDPNTGILTVGEERIWRKSAATGEPEVEHIEEVNLVSEEQPAMLSWDQ